MEDEGSVDNPNHMKKYYCTLTLLIMVVVAMSFSACGGSDDEDSNSYGLNLAYSKLKSSIIGTFNKKL